MDTDDLMDTDDVYAELCDLFDQAFLMGREDTFAEPDTDPERHLSTSPQAALFANAVLDLVDDSDEDEADS
jgi:hypothetical protein